MHFGNCAALAQMRMVHRLFQRSNWRDRNARGAHHFERLFIVGHRGQPSLDDFHHRVSVFDPGRQIDETRVAREFRMADCFAKLRPMPVHPSDDDEVDLFAPEDAARTEARVVAAGTFDAVRATTRRVHLHAHVVVAEIGVEQRDVDVLADAGTLAIEQSACDRQPIQTGQAAFGRSGIQAFRHSGIQASGYSVTRTAE